MKLEEAVQEIKRRVDLVQVIGNYVKLTHKGNSHLGLCPFHNEKSPSFNVRADQGYFKCFGCGAGGDVFTFLEKYEGLSFVEAAKKLATDLSIPLEASTLSNENDPFKVRLNELHNLLEKVQGYFVQTLTSSGQQVKDYVTVERKLSNDDIVTFGIGYGGKTTGFLDWCGSNSIELDNVYELGLLTKTERGNFANFAGRITIPIRNKIGKIIGFGGRIIFDRDGNAPKYVNSKASILFDKKRTLYGIHYALPKLRKGEPVVFAEGYFDVMALQRAGFAAVAPMGTSLTKEQISELPQNTEKAIICFDQDAAGRVARDKSLLLLLSHGFHVNNVSLKGKDPDELFRAGKQKELTDAVLNAKDALAQLMFESSLIAQENVEARVKAIDTINQYLAAIQRPLVKQQYTRLASNYFHERESVFTAEGSKRIKANVAKAKPKEPQKRDFTSTERLIFYAVLTDCEVLRDIPIDYFHDFDDNLVSFFRNVKRNLENLEGDSVNALKLAHVSLEKRIVKLLIEGQKISEQMTKEQAKKIISDWCIFREIGRMRVLLNENQERVRLAEAKGDIGQLNEALNTQSEYLRKLKMLRAGEHVKIGAKEDKIDTGGWT